MGAVAKIEPAAAPATPVNTDPSSMLWLAIERGADVTVLERLMSMQERWQETQARLAFEAAMAAARAGMPIVAKDKAASFGSGKAAYRYESLGAIAAAINPVLAQNGLSYRFEAAQDGGAIIVTCIISHEAGHTIGVTLACNADGSGSKNAVQSIGSAVTYLQRYTLKMAFGIAVAEDDDGHAVSTHAAPSAPRATITEAQEAELREALDAAGVDVPRVCTAYRIAKLSDLPADQFAGAMERARKSQRPA